MSPQNIAIVKTEYGPVKGVRKSTLLGREHFSFQAIPYMKAPVGKLRFRDAQAPEKWTEPFDSNIERPSYVSFSMMTMSVSGQENAGIVSVDTPYLDRKLPVAVYIHGGGFQFAYGSPDLLGSDYLLQKDICIVKINYRVGPIGFLSLKDPKLNIPGNAGMKDQVFALKWVQKNIANFGGDPRNVTIFGTSAGGTSVHLLMMSPLAKGLFHKAIPMSGTSFIKSWAMAPKKDLTERLAESLGWDGKGGEGGILEVLENATAEELVEKELKLLTQEEKNAEHILFPFTPVVEPYVTESTFMSKDPILMGREAWSSGIDIMVGGTSNEGSLMALFREAPYANFLQKSESFVLSRELGLDMSISADKQKASVYGEKLRKLYFADALPSADNEDLYLKYAGDLHFWHGIYRSVLSRVNSNGNGKTYLYRFDLNTDLNFGKAFFNLESEGAGHGEDMFYLFHANFPMMKGPSVDSKEFESIKKMVSIVSSFVISGSPHGIDEASAWEPATKATPLHCFNISNDSIEVVPLPGLERLQVWDEILRDANVPVY